MSAVRGLLAGLFSLGASWCHAATLSIINTDGSGEGFNSTTAATPVGGNPGTTLGEQRLIVFQRAAEIWGQRLTSSQVIKIEASFDALECGGGSAVLGSAGPTSLFVHNFGGPRLVAVALREALSNSNVNGGEAEIETQFNSSIDTGCLGTQRWWYGIDPNVPIPANRIPLLSTVLHELGHGLGFLSVACLLQSGCGSNWPSGGYPDGILDRWADFQRSQSSGLLWSGMSNAQRLASATSVNQLVWNGSNVTSAYPGIPVASVGLNGGLVKLHAPNPIQLGSSVSHFTLDSNAPDLLMEPIIGGTGRIDQLDLSTALFRDLGWNVSNGAGPTATQITADTPDPSATGASYTVSASVTRLGPSGTVSGTVSVTDGTSSCTTPALVSGAGSCNLSSATAGNKTLVATYSGNTALAPSSDVESHQVITPVNTITTISSDTPDPSLVGQSYTVSASVARASGSGAAPTGSVTVSEGSNSCNISLSNGSGSCALVSLLAGNRSLVATYGGAAGFNSSVSSAASHTVNRANTAISITADTPDPSVAGQAVNVSFALSVTGAGSGTPGGTVTISGAVGESCIASLPASSCSLILLAAGPRSLSASYSGDANYNASSASAVSHTVNKAATSISIVSDSPDPSVVGQNVTVTAALSVTAPGSGTPGGTVTISAAGNPTSCSYTLPATSCALPLTGSGARPLTASYSGDANFNASTSVTAAHTVNRANTTLSIISDTPDPSASGAPVTVGVLLQVSAPGAGAPGGTITVTANGGAESCLITLPATSCQLVLTAVGSRQINASYIGDSNFNASSASNVPHTVTFAPTTTTILGSTPNPSVFGQNYVVSVQVAPSAGGNLPAGTAVSVNDGNGVSCNLTLDAAGNGSCALLSGAPGPRTLRATFAGSGNFLGSNDTRAHTINRADSSLSVVSDSPDPSNPGQNVVVRFSVQAVAPGAGVPSGTINIAASPTETCNATLPATSCALPLTELGTRSITLNYSGDGNFNGSGPVSTGHVVTDVLVDEIYADGFE